MIDEELKASWRARRARATCSSRRRRIICPACRKAYPIRDGIPVMLISEAEPWTPPPVARPPQAVILAGGQGTRLRPLTLAARRSPSSRS